MEIERLTKEAKSIGSAYDVKTDTFGIPILAEPKKTSIIKFMKRTKSKIKEINKRLKKAKGRDAIRALTFRRNKLQEELNAELQKFKERINPPVLMEGVFGNAYRRHRITVDNKVDFETFSDESNTHVVGLFKNETKSEAVKSQLSG